jgi:Xaa-Pro dipeptidase
VRAGRNTLAPYNKNPPDLTVTEDDIIFLDLGPVFEEWEADFGRTFVVGNDPLKQKLCRDIAEAFASGKHYFQEHLNITGVELYGYTQRLASWLGVWRPHRRTPYWRVSAREDRRGQNHSLCPS